MHKFSAALVAVALLAASAAADTLAPYQSLCQINDPLNGIQGSGTLIATSERYGLILTCRHVVEQAGVGGFVKCSWLLAGKQVTTGVVWKIIEGDGFDTDMAVVICERPAGVTPVRVAKFNPDDGPWVASGFRGGMLHYKPSDVARLNGTMIITFNPAVGGQSGGCLFNRFGQLVGIVVASDRRSITVSSDGPLMHQLIGEFRRR